MLCGNGDQCANGTRLEKLEEMQENIVRRMMPTKLIRPAMIYGAETLATTKKQENAITVNEMGMLRFMYGLTHKDTIWNEHLRGTTRVAQASKKITERMSNWQGYVMRRDEDHTVRKVFRTDIPGKGKRGRPKIRWKEAIQRYLEKYRCHGLSVYPV